MSRVFLIRHGQTAWNKEEIFRGTLDIPLNEFGRNQARELGRALGSKNLNDPVLTTSPLERAKETAEIAGAVISCHHLRIEQAFNDLNFGEWQGKTKTEVEKLFPSLYELWVTKPGSASFPGGETLALVADRAEAALYRLAEKYWDRDLIIVSHRVVIKVLLCRLIGVGLNQFWKLKQDTACLNVLEYRRSSFIVATINDTCHLLSLKEIDARDF